eukprot:m.50944 g.50944  ORF g.50944 m.50944 type:complete len:51 (-) comp48196_c0_seq2:201-353(-)
MCPSFWEATAYDDGSQVAPVSSPILRGDSPVAYREGFRVSCGDSCVVEEI